MIALERYGSLPVMEKMDATKTTTTLNSILNLSKIFLAKAISSPVR